MSAVLLYTLSVTYLYVDKITLKGFGDSFRPLIYFIYFIFPLTIRISANDFKKLLKFIVILSVVQIIFSILVYIEPLWPLVDIYKGRVSSDIYYFHFLRWSGTFGYPSDFSFYLSFIAYLGIVKILFNYSEADILKRKYSFLLLLMISILFTFSRGGIFTFVTMIFILMLYVIIKDIMRLKLRLTVFFVIFVCVLIGIVFLYNTTISSDNVLINYIKFSSLDNKIDSSTLHRLNELNIALRYFIEYFPFGSGPNRIEIAKQLPVVESLYGYLFIKWGFIGFILYLISIFYFSKSAIIVNKVFKDQNIKIFAIAFLTLTISVPLVFGLSSAITDRYKCLPFFYTLAGYIVMLKMIFKSDVIYD